MSPIFGVWRPAEPKLVRRIHDRLSNAGGCETVRYEPSRRDANEVVAKVDPVAFLEREYSSLAARLRVEFDLSGERPHYWIQWWELVDRPDGTTDRRTAEHVEDEHPYRTFERRFASIPGKLARLNWE